MPTRVKPETIKKIAGMGMARALREASEGNDPEFKEAVKRYYPKAQYGPKSKAAAEALDASDKKYPPQVTSTPPQPTQATPTAKVASTPKPAPPKAAVARRVEPSTGGTKTRTMRGVNQKKSIIPKGVQNLVRPPGMKMWPWEKDKGSKKTNEQRLQGIKQQQAKKRAAARKQLGI